MRRPHQGAPKQRAAAAAAIRWLQGGGRMAAGQGRAPRARTALVLHRVLALLPQLWLLLLFDLRQEPRGQGRAGQGSGLGQESDTTEWRVAGGEPTQRVQRRVVQACAMHSRKRPRAEVRAHPGAAAAQAGHDAQLARHFRPGQRVDMRAPGIKIIPPARSVALRGGRGRKGRLVGGRGEGRPCCAAAGASGDPQIANGAPRPDLPPPVLPPGPPLPRTTTTPPPACGPPR